MLAANAERILARLSERDRVLDVGGWGKPVPRADWVLDLKPYSTRGMYGEPDETPERFTAETWVERDICAREPWPFADDEFEFAICSHTLEDVRDPVWVCSELTRVARAGYVEVPSRLEEQAWGVAGEWAGWSHHRWLCDVREGEITFVFKPHVLHGTPAYYLPAPLRTLLTPEERVQAMFWEGSFEFSERILYDHDEFESYMAGPVRDHRAELEARRPSASGRSRLRQALGALGRGRVQ